MTSARDPGSASTGAIDQRLIDAVVTRLSADMPAVPRAGIEAQLRECLEATREAPIQTFRLVLAERETRTALRGERRRNGQARNGHEPNGHPSHD